MQGGPARDKRKAGWLRTTMHYRSTTPDGSPAVTPEGGERLTFGSGLE